MLIHLVHLQALVVRVVLRGRGRHHLLALVALHQWDRYQALFVLLHSREFIVHWVIVMVWDILHQDSIIFKLILV
jgi:hypothetical protein|tara:strand:+ start:1633 stop:1857 length:225 start_codon:yes stop_codon:yes gene_type:complete